jgi:xylulokinase
MGFLLGIDLGSGGCKVSLLDTTTGKVKTLSDEYLTYYPAPGWAEQDPEAWILSASNLIRKILDERNCKPVEIEAVGLSGVTHSLVTLDKNNHVLGKTIHLTDSRSKIQAEKLKRQAGGLIEKLGLNTVDVMWTISMLDWIREKEPDRWKKIAKILFPKDYLRYRLTGLIMTDHIDAQGTLLFNPEKKKWEPELAGLIGLDMNVLPEIENPTRIVGKVTDEGSGWSGLAPDTPVITGSTDTLCEIFAAGSRSIGDTTIKLATFGRITVISDRPVTAPGIITYTYIVPGLWYPGTGTRSCGTSLRWFRDEFCRDLKGRSGSAYKAMEEEAKDIKMGSDGVIFHPYLQGEGSPYDDPDLRGDFVGLTLHHNRGHMIKAVLEGVAFSLLDSIEYIREKGITIKPPVKFIGGGSRSRMWTGILADIIGMDAVVPEFADASVGAALLAGIGTGFFKTLEEALDYRRKIIETVSFNKRRNQQYKKYFNIYRDIQSSLENIYHNL